MLTQQPYCSVVRVSVETVFGIFTFDIPGDMGGPNWSHSPGCLWHIILVSIVAMLIIGFLKWMS
ncbi:MAG: hypothetical protein KDA57_11250 [Planctomycetales bacterium]|nr:hypothetical protein [Planctomycetales bacterium]